MEQDRTPHVLLHYKGLEKEAVYRDEQTLIKKQGFRENSIVIGNDVWIGYGTQIMAGMTIANGSVVAAGAVVAHDN